MQSSQPMAQAGAATDAAVGAPSQPLVSLSPASIRAAPGLDRIVLPSPNGSALASALARSGCQILAGCLRNHTAIATWLASQPGSLGSPPVIAVMAAGEQLPDGTLRPAAEDLWGAGGIIAALDSLGVTGLSPEARSAAAAWRAIEQRPGPALASCGSGAELAGAGFGGDVAIAGELDASSCVPVLTAGRFTDASRLS
jgi:2-phosphosulfolactate phosphatase